MDDVHSPTHVDCLHLHMWEDDGGLATDASASGVTSPSVSEFLTTVAAKTPVALLDPTAAPMSAAAPNGEC